MTKFVAYYRVSTDRQGQSGLGLEAQRDAVARHIGQAELVAEFTEVESGRKNDRVQLAAALAKAKSTKATLVILFFMHVKYSSKMTKLIVGTALFFLAILFVETMMDYTTRHWYVAPAGNPAPGSLERLSSPVAEAAPAPAEK